MMIGIDLVYIPEFEQRLNATGSAEKIFLDSELQAHITQESLAGVFAAKEAFFKAIGKKLDWKDVWVEREPGGRPILKSIHLREHMQAALTISHSGEYAIAAVVIIEETQKR